MLQSGRLFLALLVLCGLLAVAWAAATAQAGKGLDSIVGGTGATGGLFNTPRDVAVNFSTGDVYVVDDANHRIQRLSAVGVFERAWGRDVITSGAAGDTGTGFEICVAAPDCKAGSFGTTTDAPAGELDNPQGIAINQSTGAVYVRDRDNRRVQQFDADGNFVRAWGFNVAGAGDPGDTGSTFEVCTTVCQIGATGAGVGQFASSTTPSTGIDVSSVDGDVFVVDPGNRRVQRFNADGTLDASPTIGSATVFPSTQPRHLAMDPAGGVLYVQGTANNLDIHRYDLATSSFDTLGPLSGSELVGPAITEALKIDPASGHLLVGANPAATGLDTIVQEISGAATGSPVRSDTHMSQGAGNLAINGLGASATKIYVTTTTGSSRVLVLDADGSSPPVVQMALPTAVGAHGATFQGTVTPGGPTGVPTSYRFEYSQTGRDDDWTPVAPLASIGDGNVSVPVDDVVTGLEANTFYRVRLVAIKAFDSGSAVSAELSFLTDKVAPEVTTLTSKQRGPTFATVTGRVNANNLATTWHFEYGKTTAYGSNAPVPAANASGGIEQAVERPLTGLAPNTLYHYRLVATNSEGTTFGADRTFTTRPAVEAPAGRGYEMVTPAAKTVRTTASFGAPLHELAATGIPSLNGESMIYSMGNGGTADAGGGAGSSHFPDMLELTRDADGWHHESIYSRPSFGDFAAGPLARLVGYSGDLGVQAWRHASTMFESKTLFSTRTFDGTGPDSDGWHEWIEDPLAVDMVGDGQDRALVGDDGQQMVRWGDDQATYRGLLGLDDPSRDQLTGTDGGDAIYRASGPDWTPDELVSECTGSGGSATQVPARIDSGAVFPSFADDTIGAQPCETGTVTSKRGATLGAGNNVFTNAMSTDGRRIFFTSPDSRASNVPASCAFFVPPADPATGTNTDCPPQLYVRQYDNAGVPTLRWISRSEVPNQSSDLLGTALFEAASADGRTVFFRTTSPLVDDDPNATGAVVPGGVVAGSASSSSWDLYRYRIPTTGTPDGGELTRISGGPSGSADPSTNRSGNDSLPGRTAVRHLSDDGKRVYFVTTSPIAGATNAAPAGGATTPGGAVANATIRNLYLYDEDKAGAAAYEFVAQLPSDGGAFTPLSTECASTAATDDVSTNAGPDGPRRTTRACVRGSSSGDAIVFESDQQLTEDDTDSAWDIYLYEAESDELTRVSAPPAGQQPYRCGLLPTTQNCNADLGWGGKNDLDRTRRGLNGLRNYNVEETGDGDFRALYFNTSLALTPADTNGQHFDVYRWERGDLSLISPGNEDHHAWYSGNTTDGEDVFVYTSQPLDPYREVDAADFDVYDVRRGGGFPPPPNPPDPCAVLAGACQQDDSAPRIDQTVGSDTPGGGNVDGQARGELFVGELSRKARANAARFGVVPLEVETTTAGRVRARAKAKVGKRTQVVGSASKRMGKAGKAVLRLRLSFPARQALKRGKALRLQISVAMPGARPQSMVVRLSKEGGR